MPSLSQITSHLHVSSPTSTTPKRIPPISTSPATLAGPSASAAGAGAGNANQVDGTSIGTHGFAMSPSGRLRLPASAMVRSRSGSGSGPSGSGGNSPGSLKSLGMWRSGSAQSAAASGLGGELSVSPALSALDPTRTITAADKARSDRSDRSEGGSIAGISPLPSPTPSASGNERGKVGSATAKTVGSAGETTSGTEGSVPAPSGSLEMDHKTKGLGVQPVTSTKVKASRVDVSQPLQLRHAW